MRDMFYFNFYPLHRQLLYTERLTLEDFGLPIDVQDRLYELYVTTKDAPIGDNYSAVAVFNEVFYLLTRICADVSAAERVNYYLNGDLQIFPNKEPELDPVSGYPVVNAAYEQQQDDAHQYIYCFAWLILKINKTLPKHVRFFMAALEKRIRNYSYYKQFSTYLNGYNWKLDISLEPCPDISGITSEVTTEDWVNETKDFDRQTITDIVQRFKDFSERQEAIKYIREALQEATPKDSKVDGYSRLTGGRRADEFFLNELENKAISEENSRQEREQAIEQSKDERIAELEAQVNTLKSEKAEVERERDKYRRNLDELTKRLNRKHIPAELKTEEAQLIINELIKQDIITPMGRNNGVEYVLQMYYWEKSAALFGYFVDKMNFQLELADSGGRINWKPFKQAFSNYEKKEKRARDTVSNYRQHPDAKMPENAEKINDAITIAEEKLAKK